MENYVPLAKTAVLDFNLMLVGIYHNGAYVALIATYRRRRNTTSRNRATGKMKRTFTAALFALLAVASPVRAAADDASGTMFYQSCMAAASIVEGNTSENMRDALDAAMCFGSVTAISNLEPFLKPEYAMCPPKGTKITYAQLILVVAKYLKMHPEQLNYNFHMLAMFALHNAWPCN